MHRATREHQLVSQHVVRIAGHVVHLDDAPDAIEYAFRAEDGREDRPVAGAVRSRDDWPAEPLAPTRRGVRARRERRQDPGGQQHAEDRPCLPAHSAVLLRLCHTCARDDTGWCPGFLDPVGAALLVFPKGARAREARPAWLAGRTGSWSAPPKNRAKRGI